MSGEFARPAGEIPSRLGSVIPNFEARIGWVHYAGRSDGAKIFTGCLAVTLCRLVATLLTVSHAGVGESITLLCCKCSRQLAAAE